VSRKHHLHPTGSETRRRLCKFLPESSKRRALASCDFMGSAVSTAVSNKPQRQSVALTAGQQLHSMRVCIACQAFGPVALLVEGDCTHATCRQEVQSCQVPSVTSHKEVVRYQWTTTCRKSLMMPLPPTALTVPSRMQRRCLCSGEHGAFLLMYNRSSLAHLNLKLLATALRSECFL
jgi:hypothetical protein